MSRRRRADRSPLIRWRDAVRESELSASARLVGLTLSQHMNRNGGSCYPSLTTLAFESGLALSTVCVRLNELEAAGYIIRERGGPAGKRATRYYAATPPGPRPIEGLVGGQSTPAAVVRRTQSWRQSTPAAGVLSGVAESVTSSSPVAGVLRESGAGVAAHNASHHVLRQPEQSTPAAGHEDVHKDGLTESGRSSSAHGDAHADETTTADPRSRAAVVVPPRDAAGLTFCADCERTVPAEKLVLLEGGQAALDRFLCADCIAEDEGPAAEGAGDEKPGDEPPRSPQAVTVNPAAHGVEF